MNSARKTDERILTALDIQNLLLQFNLGCTNPKETVNDIINELLDPILTKDSISINTFIEHILSNKTLMTDSKNKHFYISAIQYFLTPSEQSKDILHKAKKNLKDNSSSNAIKRGIDWAISTLCQNDIFDLGVLRQRKEPNSEYIKFLSSYSFDKLKKQQLQDIQSVAEIRDRRRSSLSFQLPKEVSLVSHFMDALKQIDDCDFNIFDFTNNVVTPNSKDTTNFKVMLLMSNYIFESWDLFDSSKG